jgi:hypothetical protein
LAFNKEIKLFRLFIRIFQRTKATLFIIIGFIITHHLRYSRLQRAVAELESLPIKTSFSVVPFALTVAMNFGTVTNAAFASCVFPSIFLDQQFITGS